MLKKVYVANVVCDGKNAGSIWVRIWIFQSPRTAIIDMHESIKGYVGNDGSEATLCDIRRLK